MGNVDFKSRLDIFPKFRYNFAL